MLLKVPELSLCAELHFSEVPSASECSHFTSQLFFYKKNLTMHNGAEKGIQISGKVLPFSHQSDDYPQEKMTANRIWEKGEPFYTLLVGL